MKEESSQQVLGNLTAMSTAADFLLRQEQDVVELLRSVPPEVIGARLARVRMRLGLSIRDLAAAAHVNKSSVVRLEKGGAPNPMTVVKLCAAMGIHVAALTKPTQAQGEIIAVHRQGDDRWYDLVDFGAGPVADGPLSAKDRKNMAKEGFSPMLMLKNRLETGQLLPNVLELYGESPSRSHPGEEMVYVLQGTARITVGPESVVLNEGECATFWSAEQHCYAPADGAVLPVRVLSITIQHRSGKGGSSTSVTPIQYGT